MTENFNILVDKLNSFRLKYYSFKLIRGLFITLFLLFIVFTLFSLFEYFIYFKTDVRKTFFFGFLIIMVLMDIMLPDMNGYEITVEIRKYEEEKRIDKKVPIVALTANTYDNDKVKCMEAGMNGYLAKPFTSMQLLSTVEKYMEEV